MLRHFRKLEVDRVDLVAKALLDEVAFFSSTSPSAKKPNICVFAIAYDAAASLGELKEARSAMTSSKLSDFFR